MPQNKPKNQKDNSLRVNDIPETSSIRAIRYLTCRGGGAKGVGDVGAIKELEQCGVLAQIEEVAGSSAGGIVATLVAIGCTADEIKKEMLALDFESFKDKEIGWLESTRIKDLAKGGELISRTVTEKVNLLKQIPVLGEAVKKAAQPYEGYVAGAGKAFGALGTAADYLEKAEDVAGVALGMDLGLWKGDVLKNRIAAIIARKTGKPNITFRELEALTKMEGSRFKGLTLTGSNLTTSELEYYSVRQTPDMPIVDAVRISASFPVGFQPVIMNGQVKVDGGLLENLPDVFNKRPYLTPDNTNKWGGNSQAFALTFSEPEENQSQKIKNGIDLVKACFSAKSSDKPLEKKYGLNIARIDTLGIDTLQFNVPLDKKEAMVNAGAVATREALRKILEKEKAKKQVDYEALSIEELVRRECAFVHDLEKEKTPQTKEQLSKVKRAIDEKGVPPGLLETLRHQAEARFLRRAALVDPKRLSDKALADSCIAKQKELHRIEQELRAKAKYLYMAKNALQLNRTELLARYKSKGFDNDFYNELHFLKRLEENINETTQKKQYSSLIFRRDQYIGELIDKYRKNNDVLLAGFFEDVLEDSKNLNFKIPSSVQSLWDYCTQDVESCIDYLHQTKTHAENAKKDQQLFEQYSRGFSEKTDKSTKFTALLDLKGALDKSINEKTTFLSKLDTYLGQKAPRFKKCINLFLRVVAFTSFICRLPVAIPAVGLAKVIGYFSSNPETQGTVERFVNFMKWTDVNVNEKLLGLKNTTAACIKKLNDNYIQADKVEHSYIHMLHAQYLKNSGIKLEDIFNRDPHETPEHYKKRIEKVKRNFEGEQASMRLIRDDISNRKVNTRVSDFKAEVLREVLRRTEVVEEPHRKVAASDRKIRAEDEHLYMQPKRRPVDRNPMKKPGQNRASSPGHKNEAALLTRMRDEKLRQHVKQQNIKLIHLEYLNRMDQQLKADPEEPLNNRDLKEYIKSAKITGRELTPAFREAHADYFSEQEEPKKAVEKSVDSPEVRPKKNKKEDIEQEMEISRGMTLFMKERKAQHLGTEKGKLAISPHKRKPNKPGRQDS
jgi:predicted acylesterase/phospholipase RssA